MELKQAIYTSARTTTADGYHLVARSPGIPAADQRLLARWGPSHDALLPVDDGTPHSINFFHLSNGTSCLSKTFLAGHEHSLRAGARCYTHCLLVNPRHLAAWNDNPFALYKAAEAANLFAPHDPLPRDLQSVTLEPTQRSAHADADLAPPNAVRLAEQIRHINGVPCTLAGSENPDALLAQIFECLPVSLRREWTFTTGLRHSTRRPFHVMCMPRDPLLLQRLARGHGMVVLDAAAEACLS